MEAVILLGSALWLGVVTSISPCPLATNVAAVSVLSRQVGNRKRALWGAISYSLGRVFAYGLLAVIILAGLASMPGLSAWLRTGVLPFVGPILILAGMALLGWLPWKIEWSAGSAEAASKMASWGLIGEFLLGSLFALSFCPVSAALFFGSLLPLAMTFSVPAIPVLLYGVGTSLPVVVIAILIVISSAMASAALGRLQLVQRHALHVTAWILLAVGVWLTLKESMGLF
jgi:cytochrome c-type biogenesis protein